MVGGGWFCWFGVVVLIFLDYVGWFDLCLSWLPLRGVFANSLCYGLDS